MSSQKVGAAIMMAAVVGLGTSVAVASQLPAGASTPARPAWANEPVKDPWAGEQVTLYMALSKIAGDLRAISPPPVIVLEGWMEDWIHILRVEPNERGLGASYTGSMGLNPQFPLFTVDTRGKTLGELLDEVCTKAQGKIWRYDARHNVVSIIQEELATDARWPLNAMLGEAAQKRMTFDEAHRLLEHSFGWLEGSTPMPMTHNRSEYEAYRTQIVWEPGQIPTPTVRDLAFLMIRAVEANRLPDQNGIVPPPSWYFIRVMPDFDPRQGYQGLSPRRRLRWMIDWRTAINATQLQERAAERAELLVKQRAMFGDAVNQIPRISRPIDE